MNNCVVCVAGLCLEHDSWKLIMNFKLLQRNTWLVLTLVTGMATQNKMAWYRN